MLGQVKGHGQLATRASASVHTLVPPPFQQPMPQPPPAHNVSSATEMALEGKVRPCSVSFVLNLSVLSSCCAS